MFYSAGPLYHKGMGAIDVNYRGQLGMAFFNWVRDVCMDKEKYAVPLIVPIGHLGKDNDNERMQYQVLWYERHRSFKKNNENTEDKKSFWNSMAQDDCERM